MSIDLLARGIGSLFVECPKCILGICLFEVYVCEIVHSMSSGSFLVSCSYGLQVLCEDNYIID